MIAKIKKIEATMPSIQTQIISEIYKKSHGSEQEEKKTKNQKIHKVIHVSREKKFMEFNCIKKVYVLS